MIPRYTRPEMGKLWTEEKKYATWLEVEISACEALSRQGKIPRSSLNTIRRRAFVDAWRIEKIERTVKHDVIAFLTQVGQTVGPASRYIHMGLTSSDILDTAVALTLVRATDILIKDVQELAAVLKRLAKRYQDTPMIGRSHGIHAEPITFGIKVAGWYSEVRRDLERLHRARAVIAYGKISGAVGTFAHLSPDVEAFVCRKLGLKPEPVSTQVVPRDRHAEYLGILAVVGGTMERIAVEIRHLARTEVTEVQEPFSKGQKGSSAMPHKQNPILCENLTGLARLLRAYAHAAFENIALWHERDISHSSVERVILPDATIALDFGLHRLTKVLSDLRIYPENMKKNMALTSELAASQKVLLALVKKGFPREKAYWHVQTAALAAWKDGTSFRNHLLKNKTVAGSLSSRELDRLLRTQVPPKNTRLILRRAGIS